MADQAKGGQGNFIDHAKCVPGGILSCDDQNACTIDSCDLTAGCSHTQSDGYCSDGGLRRHVFSQKQCCSQHGEQRCGAGDGAGDGRPQFFVGAEGQKRHHRRINEADSGKDQRCSKIERRQFNGEWCGDDKQQRCRRNAHRGSGPRIEMAQADARSDHAGAEAECAEQGERQGEGIHNYLFYLIFNAARTGAKLRRCSGVGPNLRKTSICKAVP